MSTFAVSIEKIGSVFEHPNADRLELATLRGKQYQFVVQKGLYKTGDKVVYFPVDSILPENIIVKMGLEGKLSGGSKNRVKTIRLRGQISQGLVSKATDFKFGRLKLGTDVKDVLGIIKYKDNPVQVGKRTRLVSLPDGINYYDIEGAQNYPDIADILYNEMVYVTEKLEGTHYTISYLPETDEIEVCSRRMKVEVDSITYYDDNPYWKVTVEKSFNEKIKQISGYLINNGKNHKRITLRGELIGNKIQNNIYNIDGYEVYFFEIELDSLPVSSNLIFDYLNIAGVNHVPVLWKGFLKYFLISIARDNIQDASNGYSCINPEQLREGIVIRPFYETFKQDFGRLILKQRSPVYLANSDL